MTQSYILRRNRGIVAILAVVAAVAVWVLFAGNVARRDHDQGFYPDYWVLVTTRYIAGNGP